MILQALLKPFIYISSNPGKGIRELMIEGFNTWLKVPGEKLKTISRVVTMLHSASLL
jgi:geranylgeranyl diphosphate synthase, type III